MEWNEANASRVCIPDLDRETSVAEVQEVLHKLTVDKDTTRSIQSPIDNTL